MQNYRAVAMLAASLATSLAGGCSVGPKPANLPGSAWQPTQGLASGCAPLRAASLPATLPTIVQRLAPGDRIRIALLGDTDRLSGIYVIAPGGTVEIAGLPALMLGGLELPDAQRRLVAALAAAGVIRDWRNAVTLRLVESVAIRVSVSGAVFASGVVSVGERSEAQRAAFREANGDANGGRTLSAAIRAAGGIRPDADITQVRLERDGATTVFDLSGAIDGSHFADTELAAGDRVSVPARGCFDASLVRPSAITMGGIRVYMSNLSRPANNNAGAGVNKDSGALPYGTRMLQALVSMNCVGGSAMNARRRAVLISRNPLNGQSIAVERNVEDLVRSAGRDGVDPWLMPEDALACYDSKWMNFQDAIGFVSSAAGIATPAILLRNASK